MNRNEFIVLINTREFIVLYMLAKLSPFLDKDLGKIFSIFKLPELKWYLGKLAFGTPYFYPINFNPTIISIRRLKRRSQEDHDKLMVERPWCPSEDVRYSNVPMVRRTWDTVFTIFNRDYFMSIGWPIMIKDVKFGWKDKYDTPRFEFAPSFQIYFFKWQFVLYLAAPKDKTDYGDSYWEHVLWFYKYQNMNIKKAKKTWPWRSHPDRKSTWNDNYLKTRE